MLQFQRGAGSCLSHFGVRFFMFVGNGAFCVNHALLDFADGLQGRMWPIVKRAACEEQHVREGYADQTRLQKGRGQQPNVRGAGGQNSRIAWMQPQAAGVRCAVDCVLSMWRRTWGGGGTATADVSGRRGLAKCKSGFRVPP